MKDLLKLDEQTAILGTQVSLGVAAVMMILGWAVLGLLALAATYGFAVLTRGEN